MKRLIIATLALVRLCFGQGAVTLVQQTEIGFGSQASVIGTNPSASFASAQTAGDANIVIFEYCGTPGGSGGGVNCVNSPGPTTSVTDTAGNTYTRNCGPITTISSGNYTTACGGGSPTIDARVTAVEVWSSTNIKAASSGNTVTANMTNSSTRITGWNIWLFQIIHPASGHVVFDQYISKQSNATAGPISTGTTPTTTYANEFLFAFCATDNGTCPPSFNSPTWTEAELNGEQYYDTHSDAAYRIVSSTLAASETFTAGSGVNEWLGMLVTFGVAPAS